MRIARTRLIPLLALLAMPHLAAAQRPDDLIRRGDEAYRRLQSDSALAFYRAAVDRSPNDYTALSRLTRMENDIGRLLLRKSDSSEAHYRRALSHAETLAVRYPDRAESWFLLALCHGSLVPFKGVREKLEIGRDVETNLRRALSMDSSMAMAYVVLGIYYRSAARLSWWERTLVNSVLGKHIIGTFEDSENALHAALRIDPRNSYAWFELSATLRAQGRSAEAASALDSLLLLPPVGPRERLQYDDARAALGRLRPSGGAPAVSP